MLADELLPVYGVSDSIATSALPLLGGLDVEAKLTHPRHPLEAELRDPDVYRLGLLFIATLGIPMVIGAWLVQYLTASGMAAALAGALAYVLFASSAGMRFVGGGLSAAGRSASLLAGSSPLLAAAGLALLAIDQSTGVVLAAVLLMGVGFALPYAVMVVEAQWLFPTEPVAPLSLLMLIANVVPIAAIPMVGAALESGHGERALLILAGLVALAGVVNVRPPTRQIQAGRR